METSAGGSRRGLTHQASLVDRFDALNLRDTFRVKDDDESCRDSLAGLTLGAVLDSAQKRTVGLPPVSRTLFDIINEDSGTISCRNRKNWKSFRDRLRLRRASIAWASSSGDDDDTDDCSLHISGPTPTMPLSEGNGLDGLGEIPEYEAVAAANGPVMARLAAALAVERERQRQRERSNPGPVAEEVTEGPVMVESAAQTESAAVEEEGAPVRMSLMALLEETDREAGLLSSALTDDDGAEEDEDEVDVDAEDGGGEYACCVCMVRHKGAAFIPCGHTFCRLCSRELWVTRGNCPLCNGFILEILDIF